MGPRGLKAEVRKLPPEIVCKLQQVCDQGYVYYERKYYKGRCTGKPPDCNKCDFPGCEF